MLGGSKTLIATTFLLMIQTLYTNYKVRLSDLTFFEDIMDTCLDVVERALSETQQHGHDIRQRRQFCRWSLEVFVRPHNLLSLGHPVLYPLARLQVISESVMVEHITSTPLRRSN